MSKEIISLEKAVQKSHCEYPEDLPEVVLSSETRKACFSKNLHSMYNGRYLYNFVITVQLIRIHRIA